MCGIRPSEVREWIRETGTRSNSATSLAVMRSRPSLLSLGSQSRFSRSSIKQRPQVTWETLMVSSSGGGNRPHATSPKSYPWALFSFRTSGSM